MPHWGTALFLFILILFLILILFFLTTDYTENTKFSQKSFPHRRGAFQPRKGWHYGRKRKSEHDPPREPRIIKMANDALRWRKQRCQMGFVVIEQSFI
jgi:hypothetical protein